MLANVVGFPGFKLTRPKWSSYPDLMSMPLMISFSPIDTPPDVIKMSHFFASLSFRRTLPSESLTTPKSIPSIPKLFSRERSIGRLESGTHPMFLSYSLESSFPVDRTPTTGGATTGTYRMPENNTMNGMMNEILDDRDKFTTSGTDRP